MSPMSNIRNAHVALLILTVEGHQLKLSNHNIYSIPYPALRCNIGYAKTTGMLGE